MPPCSWDKLALQTHGVSISDPGARQAVVGPGLYLTVVAVFGVALGFLIRSMAGGIAALVGLLLVLPGVTNILPQSWQDHLTPLPAQRRRRRRLPDPGRSGDSRSLVRLRRLPHLRDRVPRAAASSWSAATPRW